MDCDECEKKRKQSTLIGMGSGLALGAGVMYVIFRMTVKKIMVAENIVVIVLFGVALIMFYLNR